MPGFIVAPRADGADVKSLGVQRLEQGQVIELGVVRERNHAAAAVGLEGVDHVVGHVALDHGAGHGPGTAVFLARIAHRHGKAAEQRHGGQVFRQLAGAYEQHAVFRAKGVDQFRGRHAELAGCGTQALADRAVFQADLALHQLSGFECADQGGEIGRARVKLQQQLQRAAARQAKAVRFVGAHTVFDEGGRPRRNRLALNRCALRLAGRIGLGVLVDQVVFNAAARD